MQQLANPSETSGLDARRTSQQTRSFAPLPQITASSIPLKSLYQGAKTLKNAKMSQADVVRSIKIKTNTLKRLQKEFSYYLTEKDKEQTRVDRMRSEGADPHDLKQAVSFGGGMPLALQRCACCELCALLPVSFSRPVAAPTSFQLNHDRRTCWLSPP
jgi:hypothetical protein